MLPIRFISYVPPFKDVFQHLNRQKKNLEPSTQPSSPHQLPGWCLRRLSTMSLTGITLAMHVVVIVCCKPCSSTPSLLQAPSFGVVPHCICRAICGASLYASLLAAIPTKHTITCACLPSFNLSMPSPHLLTQMLTAATMIGHNFSQHLVLHVTNPFVTVTTILSSNHKYLSNLKVMT